jgi:SAM-dependent methyltransferase
LAFFGAIVPSMGPKISRFDATYYDRFYRDPESRVAEREEIARLVAFVASYLKYLQIPVHTVLDLGCGLGPWRAPLRKHFRGVRYQGVEASPHLCRQLGWARGSVVDWASEPADLVVCHGVLQYIGARDARRAIKNLARLTGGALFLEALTREDWEVNCDQERTDGDVHLRPAAWYRKELEGRFVGIGGGVFLPRDSEAVLYALEQPG